MNPRRHMEIQAGKDAFRFRIGDPECEGSGLPDPSAFARLFLQGYNEPDFGRAGTVLAYAFVKAGLQVAPLMNDGGNDLDGYAKKMRTDMRCCFLGTLEEFIRIAYYSPECVPELSRRLTAMSNDQLTEMLLRALCWERDESGEFVGDDGGPLRGIVSGY